MKTIKLLILIMITTIGMQSCREDSDIININPQPNNQFEVTASVLGTVTDENGAAIANAEVTYGTLVRTTDSYGVFQFNNLLMNSSGTFIKVEKDGYFIGSRKFYPSAHATNRVSIELLSMIEVANFKSSVGKKVQFEGAEVAFGNNSIMREDGSDYNGNVKVFAKYLDPTALATLNQMPGDLTAINASDEQVALTSYGMVAVELRDNAGNELQIKTGLTAEVTMPIPNDIIGNAPQSIPLWYFDENQGTWVEEGEASLTNGVYVGQVAHFSFWNCDIPNDFIHLSGSILNRGVPVENVLIKITNSNNGTMGSGITNNLGVFGGFVPNGVTLVLEVYDQCGILIYSSTIGPFDEDEILPPLNLNLTVNQVTVTGTVTSCEGEPSSATYVVVDQDDLISIISLDANNTFEANVFYCNTESSITVGAVDPINQIASANSSFTIDGEVDAGVLELCEESISKIFYYQFGDEEYSTNSSLNDTLILFAYTKETIAGTPDKVIYSISILDWLKPELYLHFTLEYEEGVPMKSVTIPVPMAGFNASGTATIQKVEQGGSEYITATGTLSEIEITDELLYDPSYNPLYFYTALKL